MKNNYRVAGLLLAIMLAFIFVQPLTAQEMATKEECVEKVNMAVELIQKEGPEASFKKIMDKNGPFIWKDSYIFCIGDKVGKTLAHPLTRIIGFPMKNFKDEEGNQPFIEILEVANKEGKGWKSYHYSGPGKQTCKVNNKQTSRLKTVYFSKVPGKNVIVAAGYYKQ